MPPSVVQDCLFSVVVQFHPADALLNPEPGGDQGNLFARNVVQGYVRACESSFFCVSYLVYYLFRLNTLPLRGPVSDAPFHLWFLSSLRLTPATLSARGRFLARFLPCISAFFLLDIDKDRLDIAYIYWSFCRRVFPPTPPPHRRYATGSRAFSAPPPGTPAVGEQIFDGWLLPCSRVCVSFNYFSSRVPGSITRPLEVWRWVSRSRIFDSWSTSKNRIFSESSIFLHMLLIRMSWRLDTASKGLQISCLRYFGRFRTIRLAFNVRDSQEIDRRHVPPISEAI